MVICIKYYLQVDIYLNFIGYWFSDIYADISEFVGLTEKNVSVRLTRIRKQMKQYLIEREVYV